MIENLQKREAGGVAIEIPSFGKFVLVPDYESESSLYSKKLLFEPNASLGNDLTKTTANQPV